LSRRILVISILRRWLKPCLLIILVSSSFAGNTQHLQIDSLQNILKKKNLNKEQRASTLLTLGMYQIFNLKSHAVVEEGLQLAKEIGSERLIAKGTWLLAFARLNIPDHADTDTAYLLANQILEKTNERTDYEAVIFANICLIRCYGYTKRLPLATKLAQETWAIAKKYPNRLAYAYASYYYSQNLSNYENNDEKAYQLCEEAFRSVDSVKAPNLYGKIHNQLGNIFLEKFKKTDVAIDHFTRAAKILFAYGDDEGGCVALANLANSYRLKEDAARTIQNYKRSIEFARKNKFLWREQSALANLAIAYAHFQMHEQALACLDESEKLNVVLGIKNNPGFRANSLIQLGRFKEAEEDLIKLENFYPYFKKTFRRDDYYQNGIYQTLAHNYGLLKNYEKAYYYQKLFTATNDSLYSAERMKEADKLRAQFDVEKKEKELEVLSLTNKYNQEQLQRKKENEYILIGFIVVLAVGLFLIGWWLFDKNKIAKKLQLQYNLIAAQKEELNATIENLNATRLQLIESEKMAALGQLTAGIAHEINNPINYISGGVQAVEIICEDIIENKGNLKKAELDTLKGELAAILDTIKNGVFRTTKIISGLRSFTNLMDAKNTNSPYDIKQCIEYSVQQLANKLNENHIILHTTFHHRSTSRGNGTLLTQAITNILDNAIYAVRDKVDDRTILISTEETFSDLIIKIEDHGEGIDLELQSQILNPFFTTKPIGESTGLGLSIAYGIIKKHSGQLTFQSEPGKGTEFCIRLPKS
jgi:two-component system NtrC family sensor kinase